MDKAHNVQSVAFSGKNLLLCVDGKKYEIDVTKQSKRLAAATPQQLQRFEVSPAGYGIHWPDIDEDLSIDGLIGVRHSCPVTRAKTR